MNPQRILIAVLWIASLAAAYFLGSGLGSNPNDGSPSANSAAARPGTGGSRASADAGDKTEAGGKVARQFGGEDEVGPDGKRTVASIISRARMEISGGMGGFMNIRGMMRAFAPIAELDDAQIPEALVEVERTVKEPQAQMMFYSMLLSQWAEKDGQAAMDYAKKKGGVSNQMFGKGIEGAVLAAWAKSNPEAAWKWYQAQPAEAGGPMGSMNTNMLVAGMASSNLDTALARLDGLDEMSKSGALMGIASSASNDGARRRLLDRAASLPEQTRTQIYSGVVGQWAMSDPDAAIKWVRSLPPDQQAGARQAAGQMLMMSKPDIAGDFMLENAKPEDKGRIYDQVAGRWAYSDPKAAGEWLMKQPQGPELDGARRSYAAVVAQRDPAGAMAWATSVQNPEQRTEAVTQIYHTWRQRDAAAAETSLKGSGLPEEKIQELLSAPTPTAPKPPTATRAIGF